METTLKQKVFDLYKNVYKTKKDPGMLELAKLANIMAQAVRCCSDAEEQIGKELVDLFIECTKVNKRSVNVDITKLCKKIGFEYIK